MFDEVERLAPRAMKALADALDDPAIPARDRIRAAEAILDHGSLKRGMRVEPSMEDRLAGRSLIQEVQKVRHERLAAHPIHRDAEGAIAAQARPQSQRGAMIGEVVALLPARVTAVA